MNIIRFGESALLVNFEQRIDEEINAQVILLYNLLKEVEGIESLIPAYCSLTVCFNPQQTTFFQLKTQVESFEKSEKQEEAAADKSVIEIPVCYEETYGLDMEEVSEKTKLSRKEIIGLHTESVFRVYMLGFVAGFAYLGSLPAQLYCARKTEPRKRVLAGAVGLAGLQTGIYPTEAPGGWQIIGRTPVPTFNPKAEQPTLFKAGDLVKFKAISNAEYESISGAVAADEFNLEQYYG